MPVIKQGNSIVKSYTTINDHYKLLLNYCMMPYTLI